ncbi:Long-chain-fatty-acid--AMP ligase FadD29 [Mycobacterium basiliense]|uniref:Long-chain-fatty-acid--AMP ligase FadD29 n=1 Tax=Mycobacterium basiliense TaxID=2094119 RepID=A0A447GI97_9MYCO|nr:AMP-binding protein [Mycobacterium basiliense]VDM90168.1 Long-chain-fatty-acid--AMP ligase FadD29 [Mycobacterium basiliense]
MTTALLTPAAAWQQVARSDCTLTITGEESEALTYRELIVRAAAHIPSLRRLGVNRGEPVLITAHTEMEFLSCYLGLMLHGAVPVPIPPREVLKTAKNFLTRLTPLLRHHRMLICTTAELEEVRSATTTGCLLSTFSSLAADADDQFGRAAANQLADGTTDWPLRGLDDDAYVQYTSGSTAAPRGVVITYRNLLSNMQSMAMGLRFDPADVMASWLPLHHDMGLVASLFAAVFNGLSAVFTTPHRFLYDPLGFLRLLTRSGATHAFMPNFALEWLINARNRRAANVDGIDLRAMRRLIIASEPVNAENMRRFAATFADLGLASTAVCSGYGLAEATVAVATSAPDTGFRTVTYAGAEIVTCGRVLPGYEVRIDAPAGERAGTIKLRGDSVAAKAYTDGEKLDALDEEGFCDTHDIGFLVDDELVILGRQDEVFIVYGENRFPYDIEFVVRHESGQDRTKVACFGHQDRVLVVLESQSDSPTDAAEAERLRRQVITATGLQLDELITVQRGTIPTTTSGKIKRSAVAAAYRAGTLPRLDTHRWTAGPDAVVRALPG